MSSANGHSKRLTLADIQAAQDLGAEEFAMPEWGGSVLVRGLTFDETARCASFTDMQDLAYYTITCGLVEPKVEDAREALGGKAAEPVMRLFSKIADMSALDPKAVESAERSFRNGSGQEAAVPVGA